MQNNFRFDLSNYLIHFFRDVDLESNAYIHFPEFAGFNNIYEDTKLSALFLLRCALRHSKLIASWSYRNNKRSVYGYNPAVCFTEMPLAAFVQTSFERLQRGENINQYALLLPKSNMFSLGARPVIYALTSNSISYVKTNNSEERIIDPNQLPILEQYRYVTYNPSSKYPIDWTHEREWRWACRNDLTEYNKELYEDGILEDFSKLPSLDIKNSNITGAGVVVPKNKDVEKVLFDILTLIDKGDVLHNTFNFILSTENLNFTQIINPLDLEKFINENLIDVSSFYQMNDDIQANINKDINNIISNGISSISQKAENYQNEQGKSWVWIIDNQSEVARALILSKRITINIEGKYLLEIKNIENKTLREQEAICKNIASQISNKYSINCNYFSTLNTFDPDWVPFYSDFDDTYHSYYNVSRQDS